MGDVSGMMGADHEACDAMCVELEDSVAGGAWAAADAAMTADVRFEES